MKEVIYQAVNITSENERKKGQRKEAERAEKKENG